MYKPNSLIVWSVTPITRIALIAVFIMTLMSVIAMMILTSFVTKRIRRLRSGMKEVEQGNFEVNITSDSRDEIGEFDVDESIGQYQSLNLMLQPLIENAIAHGIDVKTDGRGKLTITGKEDGDLIVLTVADNGVGMSDEQAARILTEESKGYGVRNVNERIKLYYGEQYSLQIESKIGQGTKASIRIPKRIS